MSNPFNNATSAWVSRASMQTKLYLFIINFIISHFLIRSVIEHSMMKDESFYHEMRMKSAT